MICDEQGKVSDKRDTRGNLPPMIPQRGPKPFKLPPNIQNIKFESLKYENIKMRKVSGTEAGTQLHSPI